MPAEKADKYHNTSVRLLKTYLPPIDHLIERGFYQNRSAVIVNALRDLLKEEAPEMFYSAEKSAPEREINKIPTTIFPEAELVHKAQNLIQQSPHRFKSLTSVVNNALRFYFKYLKEGKRIYNQLMEEKPLETIKALRELQILV